MQLTLDGRSPIDISIAILREFEPPEGYYLAFSGGKDSVALKHLADLAGVRYDAHYSMTTVDPPEVTRFIKREFPDVEWEVPPKPFWRLTEVHGLPGRTTRWCCKAYKEIGGVGRRVLTGIRAEESAARAKRGVFAPCTKRRKWFISPMMAWTEQDVWAFHEREGLPHCCLYDEGWSRIGCVVCPFGRDIEASMARWPAIWRLVRKGAAVYYAHSASAQARWASADEHWEWWVSRNEVYPLPIGERPPSLPFEELDEARRREAGAPRCSAAVPRRRA